MSVMTINTEPEAIRDRRGRGRRWGKLKKWEANLKLAALLRGRGEMVEITGNKGVMYNTLQVDITMLRQSNAKCHPNIFSIL